MGKFIGIEAGVVVRKDRQVERLAGILGGDRATSNAQRGESMLRVGFNKISMW